MQSTLIGRLIGKEEKVSNEVCYNKKFIELPKVVVVSSKLCKSSNHRFQISQKMANGKVTQVTKKKKKIVLICV